MKQRPITTIFIIIATLLATACTLETDDSGDLGGFWHLESVDTLATDGHADLSSQRLFWSVQHKLLEVSNKDTDTAIFLRYHHVADSLTLSEPRTNNRTEGDPDVTNPTLLQPFGLQHLQEDFVIETLTGSTMVLRSDALRLGFKKF